MLRSTPAVRLLWLLFAIVIVSIGTVPRADGIELNRADRLAIHPSEATEVTFTGIDLRDAQNVPAMIWTSFPAKIDALDGGEKPDRNRVRYRITAQSPISGIVTFRAYTKDAISKPLFMLVDAGDPIPLPSESEQPATIPSTFEAESKGLGEHIVPIDCQKDRPFVAELVAARVGSEMDGVLVLLDKDQRELAFADDHPVTGADPILRCTPTYSGLHYLVVRDVQYRGGFRFQLRLSKESMSKTIFPPAIRLGETRQFVSVSVSELDATPPDVFVAKSGPWLGMDTIANGLSALHTELPVHIESSKGAPEPLPIPAMFCGRLSEANESDQFSFVATAGAQLTINVIAASLNSPVIPHIRLQQDGNTIAEHNWARDSRGMIRTTIKESGVYQIDIRDVLRGGGPHHNYCVSIRNDVAPLTLKLLRPKKKKRDQPHRFAIKQGEPIELLLRIERRGYIGPLKIIARTADGLTGVVRGGSVGEKANEANVQIEFPFEVNAPTVHHVQVLARCLIDGRAYSTPLDFTEYLSKDIPKAISAPGCVSFYLPIVVSPRPNDGNVDDGEREMAKHDQETKK